MAYKKIKNEEVLTKFGLNLKKIRTRIGLSQEGLATIVGLHRTTVGELERGEQNLTLINLAKLAGALNVDLCKLLEGIKPKPISPDEIKQNLTKEVDRIMEEMKIGYVRMDGTMPNRKNKKKKSVE
jgi:transcriptional regulator with XRE-family HTH domain